MKKLFFSLSVLSLFVSNVGFSKTLFCTTKFDLPLVWDPELEALIPIGIRPRTVAETPEYNRPSYGDHNRDNVANAGMIVISKMNGTCYDHKKNKYNVHFVGGGLTLNMLQSNFIINCPLVSSKRFGPVGDVASFVGAHISASAIVGAEVGLYTNYKLGTCALIGLNAGLGAGVEIGNILVNQVPQQKHIAKEAQELLDLSDEELIEKFKVGVGLTKIIPLKNKVSGQIIYLYSFRAEKRNDDRHLVRTGYKTAMKQCPSYPAVNYDFDYNQWTGNFHGHPYEDKRYTLDFETPARLRKLLSDGCVF